MRALSLLRLATVALGAPVNLPQKDYLVEDLPGLSNIPVELRPTMYAGHILLDEERETNYFFWKFVKQSTAFNRTVIWLNGGPGCSSMDGALMETGPLRVNEEGRLTVNSGSWYEAADLIFVDQPGGTGFSTTKDYDRELTKVGEDFVVFLNEYLKIFTEDQEKEIYLAGESYAGQYIPFIADAVFKSNELNDTKINLKGLLIGNGWIDPNVQSMSYIPFLIDSGIIKSDDKFLPDLLKEQERCQNEISSGSGRDRFSLVDCENILMRILSYTRDTSKPKAEQCINMYDTRLRDSYPSCGMNWPPDLPYVQAWLQKDEVVTALNLDKTKIKKWRECDDQVSKFLKNIESKPSIQFFPDLLQKVSIMLFNGNKDMICNNYGVLDMISKMTWGGSTGFGDDVEELDWRYNNASTGSIRASKNLTFVDVYDSSHMVPFDKSEDSRGLFDIFVGNFRVVDTDEDTFVETPIYRNNALIWFNDGDKDNEPERNEGGDDKDQTLGRKSAIPFFLYLLFVVIVGAVIFYFRSDKTPNKNSILKDGNSNKKNHIKKTVSWADEHGETSTQDAAKGGQFGEFFNNYSTQKKGYQSVGRDTEYEDIELQAQDDTSFDLDREFENSRN
jgi:carboxypeptidase D